MLHTNLVVEKRTRTYAFQQAIFKRLTERPFLSLIFLRYFVDSPDAVVFLLKQKARNFLKISCKMMATALKIFTVVVLLPAVFVSMRPKALQSRIVHLQGW